MRIFFLGDVVGKSGCIAIKKNLPRIIKEKKIDFVVVNGENAANEGVGITEEISKELFKSGVNEKHLFFITEMRSDTKISDRVREQVKEGRIRSYSIAGSALDTDQTLTRGKDGKDTIVT